MNFLPKTIEDIINSYKNQLELEEHKLKFKNILYRINNISIHEHVDYRSHHLLRNIRMISFYIIHNNGIILKNICFCKNCSNIISYGTIEKCNIFTNIFIENQNKCSCHIKTVLP